MRTAIFLAPRQYSSQDNLGCAVWQAVTIAQGPRTRKVYISHPKSHERVREEGRVLSHRMEVPPPCNCTHEAHSTLTGSQPHGRDRRQENHTRGFTTSVQKEHYFHAFHAHAHYFHAFHAHAFGPALVTGPYLVATD